MVGKVLKDMEDQNHIAATGKNIVVQGVRPKRLQVATRLS